jgi:hypothetical protein
MGGMILKEKKMPKKGKRVRKLNNFLTLLINQQNFCLKLSIINFF